VVKKVVTKKKTTTPITCNKRESLETVSTHVKALQITDILTQNHTMKQFHQTVSSTTIQHCSNLNCRILHTVNNTTITAVCINIRSLEDASPQKFHFQTSLFFTILHEFLQQKQINSKE